MKLVNEKTANTITVSWIGGDLQRVFFIFKIYFFIWQDNDDDSEAEKLSPLLNNKIVKIPIKKALNNSIQMDELDGHVEESEGTAINLSLKKVSFL